MRKVHLLMLSLLAVGSAHAQQPPPSAAPPVPAPAVVPAPAPAAPSSNPFKPTVPVVAPPAQPVAAPPGMGAPRPSLPPLPADQMTMDLKQPMMGKSADGRVFLGVIGNRLLYRTSEGYVHESISHSQ